MPWKSGMELKAERNAAMEALRRSEEELIATRWELERIRTIAESRNVEIDGKKKRLREAVAALDEAQSLIEKMRGLLVALTGPDTSPGYWSAWKRGRELLNREVG